MVKWLRIIASCFCLVSCVCFAYFGVRSYSAIDQITITVLDEVTFSFFSGKGRVHFFGRDSRDVPLMGFGSTDGSVSRMVQWFDYDETVWDTDWGKRREVLGCRSFPNSFALWFAHWLLVLITAALAVVLKPAPRFRFSLRGLLVVTTLVAATFGGIEIFKQAIWQA